MTKEGFIYRRKESERFCGIGVFNPKHGGNLSILFRTIGSLDCVDFLFTIGERYKPTHADTIAATKRIPCFNFTNFEDFYSHIPQHCETVAVELHRKSKDLFDFKPPKRVIYLLGAEDEGIPEKYVDTCRHKVKLPSPLGISMNLSSTGSMVLYHHMLMQHKELNV